MQPNSYRLSQLAQHHLLNIQQYTKENFGESQWQRYKQQLIDGLQMLAENQEIGRSCDELYPGGRYFPVQRHIVYYSIKDSFILIVAILGRVQSPVKHLSYESAETKLI